MRFAETITSEFKDHPNILQHHSLFNYLKVKEISEERMGRTQNAIRDLAERHNTRAQPAWEKEGTHCNETA